MFKTISTGDTPAKKDYDERPWLIYSNKQRLAFLVVLFLATASSNIDRLIIGVLLPQIKSEFLVSDTGLGVLSGIVYAFFYASLGIPIARYADRGNRAKVLSISLLVWSVMTVVCGYAQSFWQLVLARLGVGAGEAGALPPAQSLISDYFPPEKRAGAMSILMSSSAVGYAIGLILGGYIAQEYGWRTAFVIVGTGGLLLGPICLLTLKEPRNRAVLQATAEPFRTAISDLFRSPAYRCILMAITIHFFMGYGAIVFVVSLLMRLFNVSLQTASSAFGLIAIGGALTGNLLGGLIANRLAKRSLANIPKMTGWAMIATVPVFEFALSRSTFTMMAGGLFAGIVLLNVMYGPMFSSLNLVCDSHRRATAVAIVLLFANLIGLGLGPLLAGVISDQLAPTYGTGESLRWSIMILFVVMFAGGAFMLRAAVHVARALERERLDATGKIKSA